jgi:hypothetical protein
MFNKSILNKIEILSSDNKFLKYKTEYVSGKFSFDLFLDAKIFRIDLYKNTSSIVILYKNKSNTSSELVQL